MIPVRTLAVAAALAALSGCGNLEPLQPDPGQPLPVKPRMARAVPTPEELLTPPTFARPDRVDELMKRSQPRTRDRFDLPPPDGGMVAPQAGDPEDSSSNQAGPITPDA